MWQKVAKYLEGYPERLQVVRILLKSGLSVRKGNIYCDDIAIPYIGVSRAAKVDRRTVVQTVKMIEKHDELRLIFRDIRSAGASLREVARHLNLGVLEITPTDARTPGILSNSARILSDEKISIRQAIVDDPELTPEPKLILIAEKKIPGHLISSVLKIKGVSKISVY